MDIWELNIADYSGWLLEKLEVMHDIERERGLTASADRKKYFDKKELEES